MISDKAMQLFLKKFFIFCKIFFKLLLNFIMLTPIRYDGTIPTSDNTEYLPPKKSLCSIKGRLYFLKIYLEYSFSALL